MTRNAEKHLAAAKEYVAKGEEFYRKAAEEIVAAMKEDTTLSHREVGEWFGKSKTWVGDIVRWHTNDSLRDHSSPFSNKAESSMRANTKRVLREAPPEQIAEMLSDPEIRAKVSHAQDIASSNLQARSRTAERKATGEQAFDDLEEQNNLHRAEAKLFEARRALIETLRLIDQAGGALTDSWREEFLRTLDDIGAKVDLGRGLLVGALDDELENLLAEEAR